MPAAEGGLAKAAVTVIAVAALLFAAGAVGAQEKKTGDLEVRVSVEGGKDYKSCTVNIRPRGVSLDRGEDKALFRGIEAKDYVVIADASISQGWFKPTLRYMGSAIVAIPEGGKADVEVTLRPVETVSDFCAACHPGPKEVVKPGQVARDTHSSGKVLGDKYIAQVEKYNARLRQLEKEGKPHTLPMVLEKRKVEEDGKKVERTFFTCESCHTLHLETPYEKGAVAPFRKGSDLCAGCHY